MLSPNGIIDLNKFERVEKKSNGKLYKFMEVAEKITGNNYDAFISINQFGDFSWERLVEFARELDIVVKLNHPSIQQFKGYSPTDFQNNSKPVMLFEKTSNYKLSNTSKLELDDTKKLINIYGIASAMSYLHLHDIIHCNLTPENVLLDEFLFPKLSSFSFSKYTSTKKYSKHKGNLCYLAPEVLSNLEYSKSSDVYSFSLLMYQILTNSQPFKKETTLQNMIETVVTKGMRPVFKTPIPDCYRKLIEKCWSKNPDERPNFNEILFEIKNNPDFITDTVNKEEFENFVKKIENSPIDFDETKQINEINEFVETKRRIQDKSSIIKKLNDLSDLSSNFNIDHYKLGKFVKKGNLFNIFNVKERKTKLNCKANIFPIQISGLLRYEIINICREMMIIPKLNHPSIIKFIGYSSVDFENEPKPVVITENYEFKLSKHKKFDSNWDDTQKLIVMYGIAAGMAYLHSHDIIHRDLKPSNIYLDENYFPKIGGFHLSKMLKEEQEHSFKLKGTPAYLSPEIYKEHLYSKKSDVYSYSLIIYELLTNEKPFSEISYPSEIYHKISDEKYRPQINTSISRSYIDLIERCWSPELEKRPTFETIKKELETNPEFITDSIDEVSYRKYIQLINEYNNSFDTSIKIQQFEEIMESRIHTFADINVKIDLENIYKTEFNNIYFYENPFENFEKSNDDDYDYDDDDKEDKDIEEKSEFYSIERFYNEKTLENYIGKIPTKPPKDFFKFEIINFCRELNISLQLNHPSIQKCFGLYPYYESKSPLIMYEYPSKGSLSKFLKLAKNININENKNSEKDKSSGSENEEESNQENDEIKEEEEEEFNSEKDEKEQGSENEEYSDNNSDASKKKNKLPEKELDDTQKLIVMYGIAAGMAYLHSHDIIHRDLKPSNIYLDENYFPKIGGFHLSKILKEEQEHSFKLKGTPAYLSPEIYKEHLYSKKSDIYSYSLIIYELLTNEKPFSEISYPSEIYHKISDEKYRPQINTSISRSYIDLIERCWSPELEERPTFETIKKELETNPEFITDSIDEEKFRNYVKMINESPIAFESSKKIDQLEEFVHAKLWKFRDFNYNINLKGIYETEKNSINKNTEFINIHKYKKNKKLRLVEGEFDYYAYEIIDKETNQIYSALKVDAGLNDYSNDNFLIFAEKLYRISQIRHPGFLNFIGYSPIDFKNKPNPIIVTENASNNTLDYFLKAFNDDEYEKEEEEEEAEDSFLDTKKLIILYGLATSIAYLHSHNILLKYLRPNNIFLNEYLFPKISALETCDDKDAEDYISCIDDSSSNPFNLVINNEYRAPEVLSSLKYSKTSDVYNFAIIAYELITGKKTYPNSEDFEIDDVINKGARPLFKENIADCYRQLIEKCWSQNPDERPTFDEIAFQLRTNPDFITDEIDEVEYKKYIDMINKSPQSFENNKDFRINTDLNNVDYENFVPVVVSLAEYVKKKKIKFSVDVGSIDISSYKKQKKVGQGGFGVVYKVTNQSTNEIFAAKVSIFEVDCCQEDTIINLSREVEIISRLNHPSILHYIGYSPCNFKNKPKPSIITEYASRGSLDKVIEKARNNIAPIEWDETKKLINIYGIAAGMEYIHNLKILHRDLKPANILLDDELNPKIADFGLSKFVNNKNSKDKTNSLNSGLKGTLAYCSPEILESHNYSDQGDVYAFGMIVYEIVTSNQIFRDCNPYKLLYKLSQGYRPEFDSIVPYCYKRLIEKCWNQNPSKRPSFSKIVTLLKTNPDFLVNGVNKEQFFEYVEMVDEYIKGNKNIHIQSNFSEQNATRNVSYVEVEEEKIEKKKIDCFLDIKGFEKVETIFKSDFFKLYKIKKLEKDEIFIAKLSMLQVKKFNDQEILNLSNVLKIISNLNHPSIARFIGYSPVDFKNKRKPIIVTEFTSNRTLNEILELERNNSLIKGWNDTIKLINIFGIASGMMYLHDNNLIHRELKPENIFLDGFLFPKIGDFGLLTQFWSIDCISNQSISGLKGTPTYSAPEVLLDNLYTKESDVYSFAYIVYEIITCKIPFGEIIGPKQIFNEVVEKGNRPKIDQSVPNCYRSLIESCWAQNPNERPTFAEIVDLLKMNNEFITEKVNKDDYFKYVKFIDKKINDLKLHQKVEENTDQKIVENNDNLNQPNDENTNQKVTENDESFNKKVEENANQTNIENNDILNQQNYENADQKVNENDESLDQQNDENIKQKVTENDESFNQKVEENADQTNIENNDILDQTNYENADQKATEDDESLDQNTEENQNILNHENDKIHDLQTNKFIGDEDNIDNDKEKDTSEDNIFTLNSNDDTKQKDPAERSISLDYDDENKQNLIENFISLKKVDELMNFLTKECDYDTISSAFNTCLSKSPEIYPILCQKGMSLNNAVAYHKNALYVLSNIDETKSKEQKLKIIDKARSQLEKSAELGFNFSYFSLARLTHEILREERQAFNFALMGSKSGDKYSMFLLGFFKAHGIGSEKNNQEGVKMMLESGADELFDNFATDFGIYYANQKDDQNAFKWFQKAFNMNKTKATINNLGICFLNGIGVKKDIKKAKQIFSIGADKGDKNAIYHLDFIIRNFDLENS